MAHKKVKVQHDTFGEIEVNESLARMFPKEFKRAAADDTATTDQAAPADVPADAVAVDAADKPARGKK